MPEALDWVTMGTIVAALSVAGAATGILAGIFGVGGGAISVPILFAVFQYLKVDEAVAMPLAVGTSLAIIVPTSVKSARAHYRRGKVDTALLRAWAVPILLGVMAGSAVSRHAAPWVFQSVFVVVAGANSIRLLFGRDSWRVADDLPKGLPLRLYGVVVGLSSTLMGIGGGAISNLIMTMHGRQMHQSVSTSAGIGVLISVPATIGFILSGWGKPGLPSGSLGFVSVLGFALIVPATLLTTSLGVRLAHAMPRRMLEKAFGAFLALVSLRFVLLLLA